MDNQDILIDREGHVAVVTFNRPKVLNAMTTDHFRRLIDICDELKGDAEVRAVIFTGTGKGFCAGADLSKTDMTGSDRKPFGMGESMDFIGPIMDLGKPTIAAVNGTAVGAGIAIAAACDIRIASEEARFSAIFRRIGMVATDGATWLLPRVVGLAKALELIYSGDIVDARESERIGLVSYVVPADDLMPRARAMAQQFADGPPFAIQLSKHLVYGGLSRTFQEQLLSQEYANVSNRAFAGHDIKEGTTAFREKRPP